MNMKELSIEDKDVSGRRITDEYYADGEWHYEYKTYNKN